jgi:hypothetical protein
MNATPSARNLLGIVVALIGMVAYGLAIQRQKSNDDMKESLPSTSPAKVWLEVEPPTILNKNQ